jgi:hypothetical protein
MSEYHSINVLEGFAEVGIELLSNGEIIFHAMPTYKAVDSESMCKFLRAVADNIERIKEDAEL